MRIRTYQPGDERLIHEMLVRSDRLLQRLACFVPASTLPAGDVREMTANPQFDPQATLLAIDDTLARSETVLGCTVASSQGVHLFHVAPAAFDEVAPALLDRLIAWWREADCRHVRQCRMAPVPGSISSLSDVFRLDQERAYIDLFLSRGFTTGVESANMYVDLHGWQWSNEQHGKRDRLAREGIRVCSADRADIVGLLGSEVAYLPPIALPHLNSERPDALQLAFADGRIVGYCGCFPWTMHSDLPELGHIHVLPEYRSRSIGEMLLCALLEWGRHEGMRRMRLSCSHDQIPRFHIYAKAGFVLGEKWHQKMSLELTDST